MPVKVGTRGADECWLTIWLGWNSDERNGRSGRADPHSAIGLRSVRVPHILGAMNDERNELWAFALYPGHGDDYGLRARPI